MSGARESPNPELSVTPGVLVAKAAGYDPPIRDRLFLNPGVIPLAGVRFWAPAQTGLAGPHGVLCGAARTCGSASSSLDLKHARPPRPKEGAAPGGGHPGAALHKGLSRRSKNQAGGNPNLATVSEPSAALDLTSPRVGPISPAHASSPQQRSALGLSGC